jgi:ribosomal protein L7/L12
MEKVIDELRPKISLGMNESAAISHLKESGLSIIEAIKAVRELFQVNLGVAKQLVASHSAYSQVAAASVPLQEEFIRAFEDIGDKQRGPE